MRFVFDDKTEDGGGSANGVGSRPERRMEQHIPDSVHESLSVGPIRRDELRTCEAWPVAFADQRKDHRYYEIVADTLRDHFDYGYFAIRDARGRVLAIQPYSCSIRTCSKVSGSIAHR
jgi:hypothetical protein